MAVEKNFYMYSEQTAVATILPDDPSNCKQDTIRAKPTFIAAPSSKY